MDYVVKHVPFLLRPLGILNGHVGRDTKGSGEEELSGG